MTIKAIRYFRPTKEGAAVIRGELKERGVKANVRYFNDTYRIVLPVWSDNTKTEVRDYLVAGGFILAGSYVAPTDRAAYDRAWSVATFDDGTRGQIFVYSGAKL